VTSQYQIHPKIGVARLGNSARGFYLGPETTGGLPTECDQYGNALIEHGHPVPVRKFKDSAGAIRRQAARFSIYLHTDPKSAGTAREVLAGQDGVASIAWTVHLANKKPIWFTFSEGKGDLEFGDWNSYANQRVPLNNADVTDPEARKALIIDPGPRTLDAPRQTVEISRNNIPARYRYGSFPPGKITPPINSLGTLKTDDAGRLLVLGGYGTSSGATSITSFRGASQWWDDVSDGFIQATLQMQDGSTVDLEPAWVIVGSPKYAPELVNIVTLDDALYDVAIRFLDYEPRIFPRPASFGPTSGTGPYDPFAGFDPNYEPNYEREIAPIIRRPEAYRWVAQVPTMIEFTNPHFDTSDPSPANRHNRDRYFSFFRVPVPPHSYRFINQVTNGPNALFGPDKVPLMPLNSGDNSVTNELIYKFLTLTPTQYFLLHQWAVGKFVVSSYSPPPGDVLPLDREVIGNCVGGPFSPGIETTWIVRNPSVYARPFTIKSAHWRGSNAGMSTYYLANGLSLTSDPQDGDGSEPGDLTKRMAIPWQADFFDCTLQTPNISDPLVNQSPADDGIQIPPVYYVYWWPPQSPMQVVAGDLDPGNQVLDGYVSNPPAIFAAGGTSGMSVNVQSQNGFNLGAAGQTVSYSRGITSFAQMVASWADLGFIINKGARDYPYFVETERNTGFLAQGTAMGSK
jgi:L-lysine 6-oxidase